MRKRISLLFVYCLIGLVTITQAQEAKYVFLMIGDGMGLNQVAGTEYYRSALKGINGMQPLTFTQFPYTGLSRTYSLSNEITDSAAGGTALSVAHKTANGTLGMDSAHINSLTSIAYKAQEKGRAIGITTSVSIDHATPAAFYANVPDRGMYYQIGLQLAQSQFDFFGGADFLSPTNGNKNEKHLHKILKGSGYTIYKGYPAYLKNGKKQEKVFLTQADLLDKNGKAVPQNSLPYAIDRKENDLTLAQITSAAIDFLMTKEKGFFLMVEGGKIDWACHDNDAATVFNEVEDFDKAIQVAYKFYQQHPDETLIVVTADHETGGLGLGTNGYNLYFDKFAAQKSSLPILTARVNEAINDTHTEFSWDVVKRILTDVLGFWKTIKLTPTQEQELNLAYQKTVEGKAQQVKSEYFENNLIAVTAIKILNKNAHSGWTSGTHTGSPVPIYAIGVGANRFTGIIQNTEIPRRIAEIANY